MYIAYNFNLNNKLNELTGNVINVIEYYPAIGQQGLMIPVDKTGVIEPVFASLARDFGGWLPNDCYGVGPLSTNVRYEEYEKGVNQLLEYIRSVYPGKTVISKNIAQMYKNWLSTCNKYSIGGVVFILNKELEITMRDFTRMWMPEFDSGMKVSKLNFARLLGSYLPEIVQTVSNLDFIYSYYEQYVATMGNQKDSIINGIGIDYQTELSIVDNFPASVIQMEINSPADKQGVDFLHYYSMLMQRGINIATAKSFLYYAANMSNSTTSRIRASLDLPDQEIDGYLTIPEGAIESIEPQAKVIDLL